MKNFIEFNEENIMHRILIHALILYAAIVFLNFIVSIGGIAYLSSVKTFQDWIIWFFTCGICYIVIPIIAYFNWKDRNNDI